MAAFSTSNDKVTTGLGLSIAFIAFVVIVIYHCYLCMKNWTVMVNVRNKFVKNRRESESVIEPSCDDARMTPSPPTKSVLVSIREPLIFGDDEGGYYVKSEDL